MSDPDDNYIANAGFVHFEGDQKGCLFNVPSYYCVEVKLEPGMAYGFLNPEYFTMATSIDGVLSDTGIQFGDGTLQKNRRVESLATEPVDYSEIQYWRFYDAYSERSAIFPVIAVVEDEPGNEKNINKLDAYAERAEALVSVMKRFVELYDALNASQNAESVAIGKHHPSDINLLCKIANSIQGEFDIGVGYPNTHDYKVEGQGWRTATAEEIIHHWTTYSNFTTCDPVVTENDLISQNQLNKLDRLLNIVAPYWINYIANHRIAKPEISYFELAGSRGMIDSDSKTVTFRMPSGTNWNSLPDPIIKTTGEALVKSFAGSFASGQRLYKITPGDRATGTYYDIEHDATGYGFGVDLSAIWKVIVEEGEPYTKAFSFYVITDDGKDRYAVITDPSDGSDGSIVLNLPYGTDLSSISPVVDYAGEGYYYTVDGERVEEGAQIDFTKDVRLVVYNMAYGVETVYDVTLTANKSSENSILSYRIGSAEGEIDGDIVSITVPYATDLSKVEPVIDVSEFASLTGVPAQLAEGINEYVVTAENGATRTITVIITRAEISSAKNILSFKNGGYSGTIDETRSTITLELPRGVSNVFAPDIAVSEFATVSPASGVVQDFSSPVKYKVTAQDGSTKTYTVTVTVQQGAYVNEYKSSMEDIIEKIISRYRAEAADDWEWMDLGFYENSVENYNSGEGHDFDLAGTLSSELNITANGKFTTIARKIMTLTARGFNCTKLSEYNGREPFRDSKGNDVDDLVSALYNFGGTDTINGPIFALIALDMGNYSVPDDAIWSRTKLLNTLIDCPQAGENGWGRFGVEGAAPIIYAIAPYQDDPVFGTRVKNRMEELLVYIINSMNEDYSFGSFDTINSEAEGWVINALCSMGIDCHIDPRFSDGQGHSVLQYWMDNFANVEEGYFSHAQDQPISTARMATYQCCYDSMWYLGFLNNGGQGSPYYFYHHRFNFEKELSKDASILEFEIEGRFGTITEGESNTIEITLPRGTPLSNIHPKITFSEGAKLVSPNLPVTFVEGVSQPFVVRAEDGQTYKIYNVTITYDNSAASGAELYLDTLKVFNNRQIEESATKTVTKAADGVTEVLLTVRPQVDTSRMYLYAEASYEADCDPVLDGNALMDLSDWITVTVTSQDGSNVNVYRFKVEAKQQAEITSFCVIANGVRYIGIIDNTQNTIVIRDVDDTNLTSTVLDTEIVFTGLTCVPSSGIATDFASAVTYTLGGDSALASRSYIVSVWNKEGTYIKAKGSGNGSGDQNDNDVKILSFKVLGASGVINQDAGIITVTLPQGTDVRAVVPEIVLTQGAAVSPAQGQVVNLSSPVVYTVSASGKTRSYIVSVVYERTISQQLWDALSEESDVVDHQISYGRGLH
ncbi:MAG: DUF5018 domain-containing protein [Eubacteriales bacterium]|nr:DUF5018 domain-containing protein [Eubacteriales bacterium]